VVGRFPGEMGALVLIWARVEQDRLAWRGVRMDGDLGLQIAQAAREAAVACIATLRCLTITRRPRRVASGPHG
jgi:hypothetical protein